MSVGFRPTEADNEIIDAHRRPGEATSDVLRRALRALDRQQWEMQAREDMERIAASGEDLSEEPDDWGYDDQGQIVDLRGAQSSPGPDSSDTFVPGWSDTSVGFSGGEFLVDTARFTTNPLATGSHTFASAPGQRPPMPTAASLERGLAAPAEGLNRGFSYIGAFNLEAMRLLSPVHSESSICFQDYRDLYRAAVEAAATRSEPPPPERSHVTRSRKLARLHAAARRANKR